MKQYITYSLLTFAILFLALSCEDYLNKAPEADLTEKDVFGNFNSFQGFVEQMYNCIMDPDKGGAWNKYSFADETLNNKPYNFDYGNYWGSETYFYGTSVNVTSTNPRDRRIWEWAWYGIRAANLALAKIDEEGLFEGTPEEKNSHQGTGIVFQRLVLF